VAYVDPWSECSVTGGPRCAIAMCNASIASLVSRVRLIAQPTKALEYASRTAARYSQPSRVGMYVMSLSQRSLGCSDMKSRLTRFGDALVLRESVVTRNRRIALGRISALRISFATVLRQHGTAWARRSTCNLGAPDDSRLAWCIFLIRAVRSPRRFWRSLGRRCRAA